MHRPSRRTLSNVRVLWHAAACRRSQSESKLPHSKDRWHWCSLECGGLPPLLLFRVQLVQVLDVHTGPGASDVSTNSSPECEFSPLQGTLAYAPYIGWTKPAFTSSQAGRTSRSTFFRTGRTFACFTVRVLLTIAEEHGVQLEAWAAFPNHYHFVGIFVGPAGSLLAFIRELHSRTAIASIAMMQHRSEMSGITIGIPV